VHLAVARLLYVAGFRPGRRGLLLAVLVATTLL
jgi:hypothetical protein